MTKPALVDISKLSNDELIKQYHYLIIKIVGHYSKFQINYNLFEDMYQECCLTLIKERENYDKNKGAYSTFIYKKLCSTCGAVTRKSSYAITMTNRNFYTNKKRLYRTDEEDLKNLPVEVDYIEREEREKIDYINSCKIYNSLKFIKDKKALRRIVMMINGRTKRLLDKDIELIKKTIKENNL
jgi:DNA-directed RNA polymerase specialized sigma24 family protein